MSTKVVFPDPDLPAIPKTKIVKQKPQQQTDPKDIERTDLTAIRQQPPLPNQQDSRDKR